MKSGEQKFIIVIVSKTSDIDKINISINNLKKNNFKEKEIIIALKKDNHIIEEIKDTNIMSYLYNKEEEIYYDLPKTVYYNYIAFINEGDTYNGNVKEKISKHLTSNASLLICPILHGGKYTLNKQIAKLKKVKIANSPEKIWVHLNSAFINRSLLEKTTEQNLEDLDYYQEEYLLSKLIHISEGYKVANNIKLKSATTLEDSKENRIESYNYSWYTNVFNFVRRVNDFSMQDNDELIKYHKYELAYYLKNIITENANSKNKHIIIDEKLEEFNNNLRDALQLIDDEVIMKTIGNKLVNYYLLRLKYDKLNEDIEYHEFFNDEIYVANDNTMLISATDTKIKVLLMDYNNDELLMTCSYNFPFDDKRLKIYATYQDKKIYATKNYMYSEYRAFGQKIYENYIFDLKIPLNKNNQKDFIQFYLEGNKITLRLDINFNKPLSKLTNLRYTYWNCGDYSLNYRENSIMIVKRTKLRTLKRELKYLKYLLTSDESTKQAFKLRLLYHLTKPIFRKEIWLFEDKIYKAGDNGEYLYTYASKENDGIKKYYILNKDSFDVKRFKSLGKKYIKYGSIKHKLLFLNSDVVFQTHNNVTKQHSFDEKIEKYFRDLFRSENINIQHGLTVQFIPDSTNRINDNIKQYYLSSPVEKENLENKEYAFAGHFDTLKITGSPRYDGLKNNDQKQILITPTWRNYLALPSVKYGESRRHNDDFKKSNYFKIYNNLINSEKLIKTASKCGYKIIYLLHPCTSSQINDFDKNENVELIAATDDLNYEKILTESSLMVTDYSGVQFDFAYMYKPIVYFHPSELPPSYDEGAYKYETMSLGEIVKTTDELVNSLCEYMKNDCKIKDKYKKRIDKFFKYHDYNNCKRIYEEVKEVRNERKNKKH